MSAEKVRTEEVSVNGEIVMGIPLNLGIGGALLAPQLAAIGAIAALVTEATAVVEKVE